MPQTIQIDRTSTNELDNLLWHAWLEVRDRVLSNPLELRRRLGRRAKALHRIPRPLCLAIKASDRRLAAIAPRRAIRAGRESEHDLLLDAPAIKNLCRPVELYWGQRFRALAAELGAPRQVPRKLEKRGILRARRVPNLAGQHGLPVPLIDSPVPATAAPNQRQWEQFGHPSLLDPGHFGYAAPDPLLLPYWRHLSQRLPHDFAQTLRRKPIFRIQRGRLRFMHWTWLCPHCHRPANTLYLPIGAPDFATLHNISLQVQPATVSDGHQRAGSASDGNPNQNPEIVNQESLACRHCQQLFDLARTPRSITKSWSLLIAHMSGGLLFGHEVPRPLSFTATRQNKRTTTPRPSPRRDQLERYLALTDLPLKEIAHRMHWTVGAVQKELHVICRKHRLRAGRPALKRWWARHRPAQPQAA